MFCIHNSEYVTLIRTEFSPFKASRPTSLPPNTRDTLYNGLPPKVKTALRTRLQMVEANEVVCLELGILT